MLKSIINFIFSPLTTAIYNIFVLGPLHFLNLLNRCLDFVTGTNVTDLLFKTTFVDGKPQLNFFQSNSPLRPMFMTMIAISVVLVACFSSISIASNVASFEKRKWIKKIRNVLSSTTGIFLIPLCFLTALSLSGSLLNVISGKRVEMSNNDQIVYNSSTKKQLEKIKSDRNGLLMNLNSNQEIFNVIASIDNNANNENAFLTIEHIYNSFLGENSAFNEDDSILAQVHENKKSFLQAKSLIKSEDFINNIEKATQIINQLKPNIKNEQFAEIIKSASQYFYDINSYIDKFIQTGNSINKNFNEYPKSKQEKAFFNYRKLFDYVLGRNNNVIYYKNSNISNFLDFKEEINNLINGTIASPKSGLFYLRQQLSDVKENMLVVKFYQLTTNRNDSNWDNPKWIWGIPPNLFVGSIIIYVAIVFMVLNIIFGIIRILNLAMLFVISPVVATASSIDNGTIFKGWLKVVLSNIFSIFGMLIILQLFDTLFSAFDELTQISLSTTNEISSSMRNVLLSLFGLGGLVASRKGAKQIDKMFGSNKNFFGSFDGSNILRIFKNATWTLSQRKRLLVNTPNGFLSTNEFIKKHSRNFNQKINTSPFNSNRANEIKAQDKVKNWADWKKALITKEKNNNEKQ